MGILKSRKGISYCILNDMIFSPHHVTQYLCRIYKGLLKFMKCKMNSFVQYYHYLLQIKSVVNDFDTYKWHELMLVWLRNEYFYILVEF